MELNIQKLRDILKNSIEKKNLNITDEFGNKVSIEALVNSLALQIYLILIRKEENNNENN